MVNIRECIINFLLEKNKKYIGYYIKRRFSNLLYKMDSKALEMEDLVQEGCSIIYKLNLLKKWEPDKNKKITSWVFECLNQHILELLAEQGGHFRIPINQFRENINFKNQPTEAGVYEDKLMEKIQKRNYIFYDNSVLENGNFLLWLGFKNVINYNAILNKCFGEKIENHLMLEDLMNRLNEKQKAFILYHYYYSMDQTEISKILNLSRMRITQIKNDSLSIMRKVYGTQNRNNK